MAKFQLFEDGSVLIRRDGSPSFALNKDELDSLKIISGNSKPFIQSYPLEGCIGDYDYRFDEKGYLEIKDCTFDWEEDTRITFDMDEVLELGKLCTYLGSNQRRLDEIAKLEARLQELRGS